MPVPRARRTRTWLHGSTDPGPLAAGALAALVGDRSMEVERANDDAAESARSSERSGSSTSKGAVQRFARSRASGKASRPWSRSFSKPGARVSSSGSKRRPLRNSHSSVSRASGRRSPRASMTSWASIPSRTWSARPTTDGSREFGVSVRREPREPGMRSPGSSAARGGSGRVAPVGGRTTSLPYRCFSRSSRSTGAPRRPTCSRASRPDASTRTGDAGSHCSIRNAAVGTSGHSSPTRAVPTSSVTLATGS